VRRSIFDLLAKAERLEGLNSKSRSGKIEDRCLVEVSEKDARESSESELSTKVHFLNFGEKFTL
jgi:hypothetical protein